MPRTQKLAPPPVVPTPPAGQHVTNVMIAMLDEFRAHGFRGVRFITAEMPKSHWDREPDEMTEAEHAVWLAKFANFVLQPDDLLPFGFDLVESEYVETTVNESQFMDDVVKEIKRRCGGDVRVSYNSAYDFCVERENVAAPASGEGESTPPVGSVLWALQHEDKKRSDSNIHDDDDDVDLLADTDLEPTPPIPLAPSEPIHRPLPTSHLVDDLATLVRRLVRRLSNHEPGLKLVQQASEFLRRHGLQGSILRTDDES